jgi:hypothetical protein
MSKAEYDAQAAAAQSQHDRVIAREEREWEKKKALAEAMKEKMTDFVGAAVKDDRNKKSLGKHGIQTMKESEAGIDRLKDMFSGNKSSNRYGNDERDTITGEREMELFPGTGGGTGDPDDF